MNFNENRIIKVLYEYSDTQITFNTETKMFTVTKTKNGFLCEHSTRVENIKKARHIAHQYFDNIWHQFCIGPKNTSMRKIRNSLYSWLAKELGISNKKAHMKNMKTVSKCMCVVKVCAPYYRELF